MPREKMVREKRGREGERLKKTRERERVREVDGCIYLSF